MLYMKSFLMLILNDETFIIHQMEKIDGSLGRENNSKGCLDKASRSICLEKNGMLIDAVGIEIGISKGIVPC